MTLQLGSGVWHDEESIHGWEDNLHTKGRVPMTADKLLTVASSRTVVRVSVKEQNTKLQAQRLNSDNKMKTFGSETWYTTVLEY